MSNAPAIHAVPELPRLYSGDVIKSGGKAYVVSGNEPGAQRLQPATVATNYAGRTINASQDAISYIPVDGTPVAAPEVTADFLYAQISELTGQKFPPPVSCPEFSEKDEQAALKLRDAMATRLEELIKSLAVLDPTAQANAVTAFMAQKAKNDAIVVGTLSAAAAAANAIPVVGTALSVVLSLVLAFAREVATGPKPQVTPIRETFERDSYRGFSAGFWNIERPIGEMESWQLVDAAIAARRLGFVDMVDSSLAILSKAFRLPFECVFPRWWDLKTPPSIDSLLRVREIAGRFGKDDAAFRANAYPDPFKAKFSFEALPNAKSEAVQSLITGDVSKLPEDVQQRGKALAAELAARTK